MLWLEERNAGLRRCSTHHLSLKQAFVHQVARGSTLETRRNQAWALGWQSFRRCRSQLAVKAADTCPELCEVLGARRKSQSRQSQRWVAGVALARYKARKVACKARSRWAASAWLRPELRGKLQLQTADLVGRCWQTRQCWPARWCSHLLSLMHCLAAPAVPLPFSPHAKASRLLSSMCFTLWLCLKTAQRLHFGSSTKPGLSAETGVGTNPKLVVKAIPTYALVAGQAANKA